MSIDSLTIILPAFLAGLLIISTHVPLGAEVLKRGIIFIDLAVAQIAGLGVIVASLYMHYDEFPFTTQIMAFIFAISAAYGFKLCEKYFPKLQEALIGSVYVFASSLALLILTDHPHGAEEVQNLLSGQLLWVSYTQIAATAIAFCFLLFLIHNKAILEKYFYFIFALAITISVQLAGVYLVFASLILPAIIASSYNNKIFYGYMTSVLSLAIGLLASLITDIPTGPAIVCTMFIGMAVLTITKRKL